MSAGEQPANYRGPLEVYIVPTEAGDNSRLRFFARTNPGDERVEVELRAGRGGNVFVQPVFDIMAGADTPFNEPPAARPVHPAARTTPFSIDDFDVRPADRFDDPAVPDEELTEEEEAELAAMIRPEAASEAEAAARAAIEARERERNTA